MILLDTHVWIWWVHGDSSLAPELETSVRLGAPDGLMISAISCWEVAKLVERERLALPMEIERWMMMALAGSGVSVVPLSPEISIESTRLPGEFHRDPADQIIVATSRVHDLPLATRDTKMREYSHVRLLDDSRIHDG